MTDSDERQARIDDLAQRRGGLIDGVAKPFDAALGAKLLAEARVCSRRAQLSAPLARYDADETFVPLAGPRVENRPQRRRPMVSDWPPCLQPFTRSTSTVAQ
jgi:hypothetical protein